MKGGRSRSPEVKDLALLLLEPHLFTKGGGSYGWVWDDCPSGASLFIFGEAVQNQIREKKESESVPCNSY